MAISARYTHIEHDSIDSTNLEAKRLIQSGSVSGDFVVSAKTQSAGRGRLDRAWISSEGNLFISIAKCMKGDKDGIAAGQLLPFIAALAVGSALRGFMKSESPLYKWPNDVLVDGKKISGILIEKINNYAIIGIGINIANSPESATKLPATFLNNYASNPCSVKEVLDALIYNFDIKGELGSKQVLQEWMSSAYKINQNVTIMRENKEISGVYKGIDENGWLILETNGGKREAVLFGDVSWI